MTRAGAWLQAVPRLRQFNVVYTNTDDVAYQSRDACGEQDAVAVFESARPTDHGPTDRAIKPAHGMSSHSRRGAHDLHGDRALLVWPVDRSVSVDDDHVLVLSDLQNVIDDGDGLGRAHQDLDQVRVRVDGLLGTKCAPRLVASGPIRRADPGDGAREERPRGGRVRCARDAAHARAVWYCVRPGGGDSPVVQIVVQVGVVWRHEFEQELAQIVHEARLPLVNDDRDSRVLRDHGHDALFDTALRDDLRNTCSGMDSRARPINGCTRERSP